MQRVFGWGKNKASTNLRKHGVSFGEGSTVFDDGLAAYIDDEEHSIVEKREIVIGLSDQNRLLLVIFTMSDNGETRLISARLATRQERSD